MRRPHNFFKVHEHTSYLNGTARKSPHTSRRSSSDRAGLLLQLQLLQRDRQRHKAGPEAAAPACPQPPQRARAQRVPHVPRAGRASCTRRLPRRSDGGVSSRLRACVQQLESRAAGGSRRAEASLGPCTAGRLGRHGPCLRLSRLRSRLRRSVAAQATRVRSRPTQERLQRRGNALARNAQRCRRCDGGT